METLNNQVGCDEEMSCSLHLHYPRPVEKTAYSSPAHRICSSAPNAMNHAEKRKNEDIRPQSHPGPRLQSITKPARLIKKLK